MDKRYGKVKWGPQGTRLRTAESYWKQPIKWNKQKWSECQDCHWRGHLKNIAVADNGRLACPTCGGGVIPTRMRVFCASLADVFEDRPELAEWRADLFQLITDTPNIDWLLLTKRPENVMRQVEEAGEILQKSGSHYRSAGQWLKWVKHGIDYVLPNLWLGTSVEDQDAADKRIPKLLEIPAKVRFLSMEPLLGPVDLSGRSVEGVWIDEEYADTDPELRCIVDREGWPIHWIIVGGESGSKARPMNPTWVRSLRDQCANAGVAFHFKQNGEYASVSEVSGPGEHYHFSDGSTVRRVGKHVAGNTLDGETYNAFPEIIR